MALTAIYRTVVPVSDREQAETHGDNLGLCASLLAAYIRVRKKLPETPDSAAICDAANTNLDTAPTMRKLAAGLRLHPVERMEAMIRFSMSCLYLLAD